MEHLSRVALEAGLDHIRCSPRDQGTLDLIVRRPTENDREVLEEAVLDCEEGLVGDNWRVRGSRHTGRIRSPGTTAHRDERSCCVPGGSGPGAAGAVR